MCFRPFVMFRAVRSSRDHFLPPDPQAFLAADPTTGRVIVIAPTRAACETIELALGKRARCRFIWLSATVDPAFYARYLDSAEVLETRAFDPARAADVRVLPRRPQEFLDDRFIQRVVRERRGVAVFVPTRAEVEAVATELGGRWPRLAT